MRRALVTGVGGFIGSHVAKELLDRGWEVSGIDDLSIGVKENVPDGVELDIADVRGGVDRDWDVVFHAAGVSRTGLSFEEPSHTYSVNVDGTLAVLESIKGTSCRMVLASSALVQAPTSSPYAASKAAAEGLVNTWRNTFDVDAVNLRYTSVYGEGQSELGECLNVLAAMRRDRQELGYVNVTGDGSQTRDFVHISDAARITADVLEGANHTTVATGIQTSILDVARLFDCPVRFVDTRTGDPSELPLEPTYFIRLASGFVPPDQGIWKYAHA